ncbi:hypothetical protein FB45DRAFT_986647 [Roridomyces roridus]|uniref:EXPERA domain-containing protein n=1 Tax=Roridomyces roridus TaxID=1738132 RepID=A0AAD7FZ47_9AGAR|nr:hypothetical protein FB45DRAFT_986647 [Roridomyces roridus]
MAAPKIYAWISAWFLLTAPLMIWDAGYCLMRPRSMVGGDLHWFWKPYELYGMVDHVYGVKAFENGDGFAGAAAILNLLETFANIAYLIGTHVYPIRAAPLVGYTGATMTLAKTVLYSTQEYFCNGCSVGHNSSFNLVAYWILPNLTWMGFTAAIMWRLGGDMLSAMDRAPVGKSKTL